MSLDLKVPISSRILSSNWTTTQTSVVRLRPFYSTRCCKWTVLSFAIKLKIRRPRQENHLGEAKKKMVGQWRTSTKQTELLNTLWHEDSPQTWNPYSQMCVRKIISALFIPQPPENHTSPILWLSSCYNPCTTRLTKKELKTTLQTWEEDQTTFHQFLPLLTQKTQQYPEQESVDQAFHSPHPGPGQDPQFLHNKNNEKHLITAMLNDVAYKSFKSTEYSSSHYVTFFFFFNLCYGYLCSHQIEFVYSSDVSWIFE